MQYNIIFSDSSGGVKTVSESLSKSFDNKKIKNELFNLKSLNKGLFSSVFLSLKKYWGNKEEIFLLQHFDAIFLGIFLRIFGFNKIINVVHIDLITYYNSIGLIKKIIIKTIFFIIRSQSIVFVSKEAELKAKAYFKLRNTGTIYNIYDFIPSSKANLFDPSKIILGSISRLHAVKNIDLLVRLMKEIHSKYKNVELLIYGDGEHFEPLRQYIAELGCSGYIKLLGASNDKKAMYESIDALVSFSSIEGFGMTILESISFGKPVLYTDCNSGPRELMAPLTNPLFKTESFEKTDVGYLVKPVKEVAVYSNTLSDYEWEYMGTLASFVEDLKNNNFSMKYDPSPFSSEVVVEQWLKYIEKMHLDLLR